MPESPTPLPVENSTASERGAGESVHLGFLDGLRAVAALYVVFHHAYLQIDFTKVAVTGATKPLLMMLNVGRLAVDFFIVISGFCLMLPVIRNGYALRNGNWVFLKRRALRIVPPYWFALLFSLLLVWLYVGEKTGTHWDISLPVTGHSILSHALLLHDVVGDDNTINHSLWSVAVEWRIYFFFPLLVMLWTRRGALFTTAFSVALGLGLYYACLSGIGASLTFHYLGLFGFGMLGAEAAFGTTRTATNLRRLPWIGIAAGCSVVTAVMIRFPVPWGETMGVLIRDLFAGAASAGVLVSMSLHPRGFLTRAFSGRLLVFLGGFAYSIYLIHGPLLQVFWNATHARIGRSPFVELAVTYAVGVPLIVAVAYFFYLLCEKPFLFSKKRKQLLKPEAAPLPARVEEAE